MTDADELIAEFNKLIELVLNSNDGKAYRQVANMIEARQTHEIRDCIKHSKKATRR